MGKLDIARLDKLLSRMLRKRDNSSLAARERAGLANDYQKLLTVMPQEDRQVVGYAWNRGGAQAAVAKESIADQDLEVLCSLLEKGYVLTAEAFFISRAECLIALSLPKIAESTPSIKSASHWIRQGAIDKKAALAEIGHRPWYYMDTAWLDWYVKQAPVANLDHIIDPIFAAGARPAHLATQVELLSTLLSRDKRFVLVSRVAQATNGDIEKCKLLVQASHMAPQAAQAVAVAIAKQIVSGSERGAFLDAIAELVRSSDTELSAFASLVGSHISSACGLITSGNMDTRQDVVDSLVNLGADILKTGMAYQRKRLWITLPAHMLSDKLLARGGQVSELAAMEIALVLRQIDREGNTDVRTALWSAAFNLGIREIGSGGLSVRFDPRLHEDLCGGLLPGDRAVVIWPGWATEDSVLLRAAVEKEGKSRSEKAHNRD